jgi:hypothetical protein
LSTIDETPAPIDPTPTNHQRLGLSEVAPTTRLPDLNVDTYGYDYGHDKSGFDPLDDVFFSSELNMHELAEWGGLNTPF